MNNDIKNVIVMLSFCPPVHYAFFFIAHKVQRSLCLSISVEICQVVFFAVSAAEYD